MEVRKRHIISTIIYLIVIPFIMIAVVDAADHREAPLFMTHPTGDEEVPAVDTKAQGQAKFLIVDDGSEALSFKLIVANIMDVTMAHLHMGAIGENGPVVAFLFRDSNNRDGHRFNGALVEGFIMAEDLVGPLSGNPLSELIREMEEGNIYVNVHTVDYPSGEIRGQITDPYAQGN
jgi:hypothetical protein